MNHESLIKEAIAMVNVEIKSVKVLFIEGSSIVFSNEDTGKLGPQYKLVVSDLHPTVDFYISQLLNPVNLKLKEEYPRLLKYVKLYYIEKTHDPSIEDQTDWYFHPTGVIEYIPEITSPKQISRIFLEKVDETEAYCYIYRLMNENGVLNRTSIKFRVGIHSNQAISHVPESDWMQLIQTAADFYPGPTNIPIHDMLINEAPKYKGNRMWVVANGVVYIYLDNTWMSLFPDSNIPSRYLDEWTVYQTFNKI